MRTKGLVVPHSPANALLVGLDPAGGFLFGQLACLHNVLFMYQVEIGLPSFTFFFLKLHEEA